MKNIVVIGAAVLLVAVLGMFFFGGNDSKPGNPKMDELSQIVGLAERTCLSSTREEQSAALKLNLEAIDTAIRTESSAERKQQAVRGAAEAFSEALKKAENDDIRKCMEPWSERIRAIAVGP